MLYLHRSARADYLVDALGDVLLVSAGELEEVVLGTFGLQQVGGDVGVEGSERLVVERLRERVLAVEPVCPAADDDDLI